MRRKTQIIWLLLLLLLLVTCFPPPSQSSCPTCPEGTASFLDCGKWEAVPSCPYVGSTPVLPGPENGACEGGKWPAGLHAIHMVLMHTGKVLIFAHTRPAGVEASSVAHYWDYRTPSQLGQPNRTLVATPSTVDIECSGHVVKANGKALFIGGGDPTLEGHGAEETYLFDADKFEASPTDSGWAQTTSMAYERYYPTATLMPDGRVLATQGTVTRNPLPLLIANTPERYDELAQPWSELASASANPPPGFFYPFMHILPGQSTVALNSGPGMHFPQNKMRTLGGLYGTSPQWQETTQSATIPGSSAVMYGVGKFLKAGGSDQDPDTDTATDKSEIITASNAQVNSVAAAPLMSSRRDQENLVALPNGSVLAVGGSLKTGGGLQPTANAVWVTEIFTPPAVTGAGEWCEVALMTHRDPDGTGPLRGIPRMYHSTALLLPDGKVLVAGGDAGPGGENCLQAADANAPAMVHCASADYYKPPYLFKSNTDEIVDSDRPEISSIPTLVGTGSSFTVTVSSLGAGSTTITKACFIRPSAVTHALDMDSRRVLLADTLLSGSSYSVSAPATLQEAPPGYYMFFLMNDGHTVGHPSVGKFVKVWGVVEESVSYSASQACNGGGGGPNLTFNASWNTTLKSTGVDTLHVYSPGGTCGNGAGNPGTATPPPGGSFTHQASRTVACQNGTWKLVLKSHLSGSTTKSVCRTVQVTCMSCCPPPGCEIE